MYKDRREQIIDIIRREFIGPDPIDYPGLRQENGEEILTSDPPLIRYAAGILYPRQASFSDLEHSGENVGEPVEEGIDDAADNSEVMSETEEELAGSGNEYLEDAEELLNLSNAYRQSAMSITVALREPMPVDVEVRAGIYNEVKVKDPETDYTRIHYYRKQLKWSDMNIYLPDANQGIVRIPVIIDGKETGLQFDVTYRDHREGCFIYTFTLENTKSAGNHSINNEDCFFQVEFTVKSIRGFCPLPENLKIFSDDEDYLSNQLLYRNVKNYAIGHGCAAMWEETEKGVFKITTSVFPQYEIKPIVPSRIDGVSLEMYKMSDYGNIEEAINELIILCDKYQEWIAGLKKEAATLEDPYKSTAERHIHSCEECLRRMKEGVALLSKDSRMQKAFCYMNRAMLLQQLHYNLPLQKWVDDGNGYIKLENPVERLPDIRDQNTWYGDRARYGKWRPFQLAFILINLKSMADPLCSERKFADLIWFPTGGGKTEAYLGLSAFTIFLRRLKNRNDEGTAILMRYTLRLLTAQQYERAASMICACETIRKEKASELGESRISIGLWVGSATTPNHMNDAVKAFDRIKRENGEYPFVVRKCPWCGAQIGVVPRNTRNGTVYEVPGLEKLRDGRGYYIVFKCANSAYGCEFSKDDPLPLYIIDDDIYEKTPTLILGTVDKFAMLPYIPKAQSIFGFDNGKKVTAPDLIIQDELHLISGPLGSMVGHYETMINELCSIDINGRKISPKIITSTATISRAKEQCHALYNCGRENVKQFPPPGLNAGDSFFAVEDRSRNGRMYVGILAAGASSVATAMIRLYAALLYAASALEVNDETERDPYWTHIGYFNSIRELGQVRTWIRADIDEYLHVIYKRRREDKLPSYKGRRYIKRDEELTSRVKSERITAILGDLNIKYTGSINEQTGDLPIDICLATNMISVGLDVPRLGLMSVAGQPKTTSEYIQATSRVGRDSDNAPGIIFTMYNPGRPRDKSHYEQFINYHSRIYCNVEPVTVTPFSPPLRERALHAIVIGIIRLEADELFNSDPPKYPSEDTIKKIKEIVRERVSSIDPDETEHCLRHVDDILADWELWRPELARYHDYFGEDPIPLIHPAGSYKNPNWRGRSFPTPMSMRNVDASCEVDVMANRYSEEG